MRQSDACACIAIRRFRRYLEIYLRLLTKEGCRYASTAVINLQKVPADENAIVSFSVNTDVISLLRFYHFLLKRFLFITFHIYFIGK